MFVTRDLMRYPFVCYFKKLALDTTLMSSLHCDGLPQPGAANRDGAVLDAARRRKNRTYPELIGPRGRARLVVLRWSEETRSFLTLLAKAKSWQEPPILRRRAEQAWRLRWQSEAFAVSLLELRGGFGADGLTPLTHEVENTFRFAGLG